VGPRWVGHGISDLASPVSGIAVLCPRAKIIGNELCPKMFSRFVVGADGEHHRSLTGIITEARIRRENGDLDEHQAARLEAAYSWLNEHLPEPPFKQLSSNAISWFRDEARESIQKMWEIVSILRECGVPVRLLRSANPGKIVYEDDFQIVVEEWRSL